MAKSDKALEDLKKLYGKQAAINKDILAAEKVYASELKAEAKAAAKPVKVAAKKAPVKRAAAKKAPAKKVAAKKKVVAKKPVAVKPKV
jgi:hypothetical protein